MKIADYGKAITSYIESPTTAQKLKSKQKAILLAEVEKDNFNTPDLEQAPDSYLKPGETLEDFDVTFRRPNSTGGRIGYSSGSDDKKDKFKKKLPIEIPTSPLDERINELYERLNLKEGLKNLGKDKRKLNSEGGRVKLADGTTPKEKPFTLDEFKNKANIYVGALQSNALPLADIKSALNKFTTKGIEDGTFTANEAIKVVKDLRSYYQDLAQKQRLRGVVEGIGDVEREELKRGTNLSSLKALEKINVEGAKRTDSKVNRFKELIKLENKSPNEAKMIVMKEFGIERNVKAGTPKWMTRGKKELLEEGFEFTESKRGPEPKGDSKEVASKKRKQVIGKEEGQFEERLKKEKTKTGFGKRFETAHTANIFQAKKLGIEYPIDALAIQATDVNQVIAEGLNDELKPLYKKQLTLVNKLKKNNTFALRKELDELNRLISDTVATGGKQGSKAANVLKPIIVDPKTLEGKILNLGFDTSSEVFSVPGQTTKKTKAGDIDDLMARMNIKENVIQKASDIDRPEKALLSDKFKTAFTKGAKTVGKVIKPVGYAFGANAVKSAITKADEMGIELSLADKLMAFDSGDAEVAIDNFKRRTVPGYSEEQAGITLSKFKDDFEEVGKDTTFGKYNDQIKNIKLP